jgi:hypothetical protein
MGEKCNFCGRDDDMTADYALEFSAVKSGAKGALALDPSAAAANRAWEQLFTAKMMKEGLNAGACKLVMIENAVA